MTLDAFLARQLGQDRLTRLGQVRIGLAGAGGLGSNCAVHLVRSGFRRLRVVDGDRVEVGNLNRQHYYVDQVGQWKVAALRDNLLRIAPDADIDAVVLRIDAANVGALFADCDAVVEALDDPGTKRLVAAAYMNSGKLVVAASGMAGWGNSDTLAVRRFGAGMYVVGDLRTDVSAAAPPLSPRVGVAAAKQADVVLAHFLGDGRRDDA